MGQVSGVREDAKLASKIDIRLHAAMSLSVIPFFDGPARALFDGLSGGRAVLRPRHDRACRRACGRQGRFAPLSRWPEDGPSLTAAARDGTSCAGRGGRMVPIEQKDWTEAGIRADASCCAGHAARRLLAGLPATASHML